MRPLELTALNLHEAGAPLGHVLSHLDTMPHQHHGVTDCATCNEWNGKRVTVRTGHTFRLFLMHIQARELRDYIERVAALNEEEAVLEALVYTAACLIAPQWLEWAERDLRNAEHDLLNTRRDSYVYAEGVALAKQRVADAEKLIAELMPVAVKVGVAA